MPCATPPWIWPSTIIGLITRPQSCTTTYRLISTCAVSGSTSTTIAWTPFAVLPRSGPKYAVASSPGSAPGRTAPRSGFAFSASVPSAMPPFESPRRCTRPPASTRSAGAASGPPRAGALVGPDSRPLDVAPHADPHVPAGRPQAPLLLAQEAFVIDGLERLVERRLVVAAVVRERRGVLEQDLVVERELVGPEQVLATDLGAVEPKLLGREVQEPLDDEHAVLAPRAPHGGDDRLVREDRGELALVARDVVGTEEGALAVDRNREPVGIVGAGVVQEHVAHAEDLAVLP